MMTLRFLKVLMVPLAVMCCLDAPAQIISTFAGTGAGGFSGDSAAASTCHFLVPQAVACDGAGNVYIADLGNARIRKVGIDGTIHTFAGTGTPGYSGDYGAATAANLQFPVSLEADRFGNIYFSDTGCSCVRKIDTSGIITTVAGTGTAGFSGGFLATASQLNLPAGIFIDVWGRLYIADMGNNRIRYVDTTGLIVTLAGNGLPVSSGDGGLADTAGLPGPTAVTVDGNGNMLIACAADNRIRMVGVDHVITTLAGNGTPGFSGDDLPASGSTLSFPYAMRIDRLGRLFVADAGNRRIRMIDTFGYIQTVAGRGSAGYSGDGLLAVAAGFSAPVGAALDTAGNLYIVDAGANVVREVTNAFAYPAFPAGNTVADTVCTASSGNSLDALLTIFETDTVQNLSWNATGNSAHGTVSGNYMATSTGTNTTPSGIAYTPDSGYVGSDTVVVRTSNNWYSVGLTIIINVYPLPQAGIISAADSVCPGASITATDTAMGGTWTVTGGGLVSVDSLFTAVAAGTDTLIYTVANRCGFASAIWPITVLPLPVTGVLTGRSVCRGSTDTFTSTSPGGIWSVTNANAVVADSDGVLTGADYGADTVAYTVTNSCGTVSATVAISVDSFPVVAPIVGLNRVCLGNSTTLTDSAAGGTWSCTNAATTFATVGLSAAVTGAIPGSDTLIYVVANSCGSVSAAYPFRVDSTPVPFPITANDSVCIYAAIALTDSTPLALGAGTWSLTNANATLSGGLLRGAIVGLDTIVFKLTNSCGSGTVQKPLTINPLAYGGVISGPGYLCLGGTATLTDSGANGSGVWNVGTTGIVPSTVYVTPTTLGLYKANYTVTNLCGSTTVTKKMAVITAPNSALTTGPKVVCMAAPAPFENTVAGGTWSVTNGNALTDPVTGLVSGLSVGRDTLVYILTNMCGADTATFPIEIQSNPPALTITNKENLLAVDTGYAAYNWIKDGIPVAGANADTLTVSSTGVYQVWVSNAYGCSTLSNFLDVATIASCLPGELQVFPNPVAGTIHIRWCDYVDAALYTFDGRQVFSGRHVRDIDVSAMPNGAYFLYLTKDDGTKLDGQLIMKSAD